MDKDFIPMPDLATIIGEFGEAVADATLSGMLYDEENMCDLTAILDKEEAES